MVKANGQPIGVFLNNDAGGPLPFESARFWVLSDTGYMFAMSPATAAGRSAGQLYNQRVRFSDPGCLGQAYVEALRPDRQAQFYSGFVFTSEDPNDPTPTYYSPTQSPVVADASIASVRSETGCEVSIGTITFAVAVLPNDPLITGVPNQRILGEPITLGR